jgi:integrase
LTRLQLPGNPDFDRALLGQRGRLTDSGARGIIKRIGEEAGISLHPHQLRHTMAVVAFEKGAPDAVVSKLLGHRSIKTTVDVYGVFGLLRLKQQHEIYSPVAQIAERLREAFSGGATESILCYNQLPLIQKEVGVRITS